ncbi:hypothetical protein J2S78_000685 [Salibacterium salarium]|uniref:hypothetical protein n=1 Tax=Salibacterium salarium TaxID=284579 RepID=UPI00278B2AEB|nr:hypothetical protein [Salibacterium salarium]MDQ0298277.1 hypothetical protein [Salibacterium salarium]
MSNIERKQLFVEHETKRFTQDEDNLKTVLQGLFYSERIYENDQIFIQQVITLEWDSQGRSSKHLIILNLERDLDNPGDEFIP